MKRIKDPIKNLLDWLRDGKAEFDKIEIEVRSEGYRALIAKQDIKKGEEVLFIPRTHFLSVDEAKESCLVNRKMIQIEHKPLSKQTYFANHLLQEQKKFFEIKIYIKNYRKYSHWKPYIDILPKDMSGFAINFDQEKLDLLKGSPNLEIVMEQRQQFRQDYDDIYNKIPEFRLHNYTFEDFSRQPQDNSLCHLLDFDYRRVLEVLQSQQMINVFLWQFHQLISQIMTMMGFWNLIIFQRRMDFQWMSIEIFKKVIKQIKYQLQQQQGEELFLRYGIMSNQFLYMHYGIAMESTPRNQYDFDMCVDDKDPLAQLKLGLTNGKKCYKQTLVNETDHGSFRETTANARYLAVQRLDEYFDLESQVQGYRSYSPGELTWPISTPLEKKMWIFLRNFLLVRLNNFASTIEDDMRRLNDKNTPEFRRYITILTLRQKQIIKENIDICDLALEIVEKSSTINIIQELHNLIRDPKYEKLEGYVLEELIPMKVEKNE